MTKKVSIRRRLAIVIAAVGLVTAIGFTGEAIYGFLTPDRYHFGSEPMVGYGGWKYKTRNHHLAFGLLTGVVILSGTLAISALVLKPPSN